MRVPLSRISFRIDTSQMREADLKLAALGNAISKVQRKVVKLEMPPFRKNAVRKLKGMAFALAMNVADAASDNTPVGDDDKIAAGLNPGASRNAASYARLYANRLASYGINMQAGFHAGAWRYSETKVPTFSPDVNSYETMISMLRASFMANFQLGDTFYIAAKGPAYKFLESGVIPSAPDGIVKPTMQQVLATYRSDLLAAYARNYS